MNKVWLHEMTWEEVKEAIKKSNGIVLIPIGSTEQHGRHLPLGTDTFVAIALAEEAAKKTGVVVAPPIFYGWSPHHMVLPGTITIRPEVLIELLYDIIKSLKEHGFNKFIVINGHRIVNIPWIQIAAERAQRELKVKVVIFDPAYMSKEIADKLGFGPIGHGEEIETSHMLYIRPELVYMNKAVDYKHEERRLYHIDPRSTRDTLCYVPSTRESMKKVATISGGIVGEPTKASKEKGKKYHEHLVRRLIEVIENMKKS